VDGRHGGIGGPAGGEGPEIAGAVAAHRTDDRQPRERLDGELDPDRPLRALRAPVVAGLVRRDEPQLTDLGLERRLADDRLDARRQTDHLGHPAALLRGREVGTRADPDVARGADVERPALVVLEDVDPRQRRQTVSEEPLAALGRGDPRRVARQLLEGVHTEVADAFEETVQDVDRGARVVQGPVVGCRPGPEEHGKRRELVVVALVAGDELAGQVNGVEDPESRPVLAGRSGCRLEEGDVEAGVVGDEDRVAGELEEGRQHGLDARCLRDHGVGDAGEHLDEGRDGLARLDQRLELPEHLAAAHPDRTELGDRGRRRTSPRRLEVHDDERDIGQRRAEFVERALDCLHADDVRRVHRQGLEGALGRASAGRFSITAHEAVRGPSRRCAARAVEGCRWPALASSQGGSRKVDAHEREAS